MVNQVLLYAASFLLFAWGFSHLIPTKSVVQGFGEISVDNKRIITMEWITEGVALIFSALVITAIAFIGHTTIISKTVCRIFFAMLNVLSIVSLFTGFKINFLPFKLCPIIFTTSSILILLGIYV